MQAKDSRIDDIVAELKRRMQQLEALGKKIRQEPRPVSPSRTRELLEEIKVPSLKLLKEEQ